MMKLSQTVARRNCRIRKGLGRLIKNCVNMNFSSCARMRPRSKGAPSVAPMYRQAAAGAVIDLRRVPVFTASLLPRLRRLPAALKFHPVAAFLPLLRSESAPKLDGTLRYLPGNVHHLSHDRQPIAAPIRAKIFGSVDDCARHGSAHARARTFCVATLHRSGIEIYHLTAPILTATCTLPGSPRCSS
jgi:hypothetical protein